MMAGFLAVCFGGSLAASEADGITGALDWERMRIHAELSVDLNAAEIKLPSGRTQAEELLSSRYSDNVRGVIHSIRLDSSTLIGDLVVSGEIPASMIDSLALQAERQSPKYSRDFNAISSAYTIDLRDIGTKLLNRANGRRTMQNAVTPHLIDPVPAADYTGIIIIAQGELPVHGRKTGSFLVPCLFPKIWDTDMNLIYDGAAGSTVFASTLYTSEESIFHDTPSGLSGDLQKVVGDRPLRVIARGIFGINPTDPVIDRADALTILSSDVNKSLLHEGRLAFIVRAETLNQDL
jgi:hypothetical protein